MYFWNVFEWIKCHLALQTMGSKGNWESQARLLRILQQALIEEPPVETVRLSTKYRAIVLGHSPERDVRVTYLGKTGLYTSY